MVALKVACYQTTEVCRLKMVMQTQRIRESSCKLCTTTVLKEKIWPPFLLATLGTCVETIYLATKKFVNFTVRFWDKLMFFQFVGEVTTDM